MSTLTARDLRLQLGTRTVLGGVTTALDAGELVLLAGRNGAGKSTLLRALIGALRPDGGDVQLGGRPLASWQPLSRAREVAFVPQSVDTPFEFTGRELVAMGRHPHRGRVHALRAEDVAAIDRALAAVDAAAFADRRVTTLSGGELRRIAVARALATEAPLLLLDEPTNNLDLEHALQLVGLLKGLAAEHRRGVLVASHDLNLFGKHATRAVLLHDGRVFADGTPEQVLSGANVRAVFGVQAAAPAGYFPRDFV
ncbi:MAG TPA: ABC transporter ATP-binding protein [Xanthomonadales bacterium]|nr:ABC transporter ATP-binding protein [Xanthomonadales bacterium]